MFCFGETFTLHNLLQHAALSPIKFNAVKYQKHHRIMKDIFCEPDKVSTTISPTTNIISGGHELWNSSDLQINLSPTVSITSGRNDARNSPESHLNGSAVGIAFGVIVPLILLIVAGILLFKKRRQTQDTSKRETTLEIGECKALVSKEAIYLEENEQNQQQIEKEESGCSELQDLLEYMCTGPARKILFTVVKMYVENPDSYFHNESKKGLVKSVLPTEYHSAVDSDSEYRNSIPVCYTILQLSLSAEHEPKSGWGQRVEDLDTGVGDDVERVYQAHTLSREIHNPEEISVDVYVRLFEMLIGAVERLDIKRKCSEDYREIVRRWDTIQRKLWVKDRWKTFTNFIKKWS
ncbi:uncharacterized protein LOC130050773 [Ostrea edulis]|uniref:uncharacterized protein LOC130050773 n=1 Tax=Ostrea edulis TaxID=37623 RepID=UPI0024AF0964|nr:uncharacterized protein LOC130050773 [Ostrea edulis]